ncbi:amino acid adenylation domain-containing protein, partial [Lentzea sp. NPDC004789]
MTSAQHRPSEATAGSDGARSFSDPAGRSSADCLVGPLAAALAGNGHPVVSGGAQVRTADLAERASRLATLIGLHGVGPNDLAGICVNRSAEMIASILGVWRAGGAYVPLDPGFPPERLRMMVADSGVRVIVTEPALLPLVTGIAGADVAIVCLDLADPAEAVPQLRPVAVHPDDLAYVIFTSGSTGRPKGVQVTHRSLANLIRSFRDTAGLGRDDTLVAVTTLSFDIAILELLLPLFCGARLVIADRAQAADPWELRQLLVETGATAMQATPATWRMLVGAGGVPPGLRLRLCGGEALPPDLADELLSPGATLWNLYGPTETTVWSAAGVVQPRPAPVRIGPPIAHTQIYVLDDELRPVPVDEVGELYIGGLGVARGYHDRPGLTAARFLPDPFADGEGLRMYRTGDLARRLSDGLLDFLGRSDNQVKVRGFRIEIGEIEEALGRHPAVRHAVVAPDVVSGETRLLAYVVPTAGAAADLWPQLRAHLRQSLPDYMVPAAMVPLDALPLTPNGKIDRQALPKPAPAVLDHAGYVAPRTETERILADIWRDLLGVRNVGVHDGFVELGGHSLLAMQVLWRLQDELGVDLPLRTVFDAATLADLAAVADAAAATSSVPGEPPLPEPRRGQPPLSHAQQRLWFLHQLVPDNPFYTVSFELWLHGNLRVDALGRALTEIVRRHEVLRTSFGSQQGVPTQRIDPPYAMDLTVADLTELPAPHRWARVRQEAAELAAAPFDLSADRLVRARLVALSAREHVLLLTMHHIVADGWSLRVLVRELCALYRAYADGVPSPLPDLPIQYADFAITQQERLSGPELEEQLGYWRQHLSDLPHALDLPADRPRPALPTYRGAVHSFVIPPDLTGKLRALGNQHSATQFMTLLTAFVALLSRYSGQDDIAVGSPVAGRNTAQTDDLIGLFVNTLVLRVDATGDLSFADLLRRVRAATLDAYDHQDVPFERLVDEFGPARDLSRNPLVQTLFWLLPGNLGDPALDWGDLTARSTGPGGLAAFDSTGGTGTVHCDLELLLREDGDRLVGALRYSTDLFDAVTVERLTRHFVGLLREVVGDADAVLSGLSLVSAEERRLLAEWNSTEVVMPSGCVHELFEGVVARSPDAV